jgi:RNA-directed DNA polymerase
MKRHGYLFEKVFSRENLYLAYLDACRGKHGKRACFNFEKVLARNLDRLYQAIWAGTYEPQPYRAFTVYEPKERVIYAPGFPDLVVQHAIYRVILPIYDPTFVDQSFACRIGKGTHRAAAYAQKALQGCHPNSYVIKLDIRKFFYSIDRAILRKLLERKIKDQRLVDFMMKFGDYGAPVGIPIGNLLSQLFALIYLNPLDHFIKREIKANVYCRYVDDFVIFGESRDFCLSAKDRIIEFLAHLRLKLSKYCLQKAKKGLNFVGYRTWAGRRFIRKHSLYRFRKSAQRGRIHSVTSILGHARFTASFGHLIRLLKGKFHATFICLPEIYRRAYYQRACTA